MRLEFQGRKRLSAFAKVELIVIAVVVCVLFALIIPGVIKAKAKARRMSCAMNLKFIGSGYLFDSNESREPSSWQVRSNLATTNFAGLLRLYFSSTNLTNPRVFACPADTRKPVTNWAVLSRTNVSYFISLNASELLPQLFLAGDRNMAVNGVRIGSGVIGLAAHTNVAWDGEMHRFQGHALMGDGSVQLTSSPTLLDYWTNKGVSSVTLAVP